MSFNWKAPPETNGYNLTVGDWVVGRGPVVRTICQAYRKTLVVFEDDSTQVYDNSEAIPVDWDREERN